MSSIAYVTDYKMLDNLRLNEKKTMNFWRLSTKTNFSDFKEGDLLFFLSKNKDHLSSNKEKGMIGFGRVASMHIGSIRAMWNKYHELNGFNSLNEFREAILKVHSRNKPIANDVDFGVLARITAGCTGADLANILNEGAILAVRKGHKLIFMDDINEGIEKVAMGPAKRSRVVTEKDKRMTAYHESGHALLGKLIPDYDDDIHEVTIIPRGNAGGYTLSRSKNDYACVSKAKFIAEITMCLGGRIAEELIIGDITTGASGDIKQATNIARDMVTVYGMTDEFGMVYLGGDQEVFVGRDYGSVKAYSDETAFKVDQQISKIIQECYANGKKVLSENIDKLHTMARVLIEKETIFEEEVDMIVDGKSVEEVCEFIDQRRTMKEQENAKRIQQRLEALSAPVEKADNTEQPAAKPTDDGDPLGGGENVTKE